MSQSYSAGGSSDVAFPVSTAATCFFAISSLGTASQDSATAFVTVTDRFAAFFLLGLLNGFCNKVVIF